MKKVYTIIFTIMILVTGLYIINKPKAQTTYPGSGTELSATVPEDGLTLIKNGQEISVRSDGSQNLDDYAVNIVGSCQAKIKMNISIPSGHTLHDGDYFSVPVKIYSDTAATKDLTFFTTDWSDLLDNNGVVIGQWRMVAERTVQIVLNENVNGKNSLSQLTITTSDAGMISYSTAKDRVGKITVGNKTFSFKIQGINSVVVKDRKFVSGGSTNHQIRWAIRTGANLSRDLWASEGREGSFTDTIIEDTFEGASRIEVSYFQSQIYLAKGDTEISDTLIAGNMVHNDFEQIAQLPGETYAQFKTRVTAKPLQYGIYKDSNDAFSIVIYPGKLGQNLAKFTQNDIERAVNKFIDAGYFDEAEKNSLIEHYTKSYLTGKTNGSGSSIVAYINAYYPKANAERKIENTAKVTYDGVEKELKATGKLAPTAGSGETTESSVTVTKKAQDTGIVLKGAKLKLQFKDGTDWVDYYINNKLEETTNDNGQVTFNNLAVGTYRVVETEAPKRYKSGATSEEFEVRSGSSSNIQIELLNEVATHKITTHHYKQGSTESLGESKTETKEYGDTYQTNPLTNIPEGYELVGTPSNASGTVEKDEIVIYEYKLKDVELTIRYVDENGNEISSIKEPHKYGDSYTTSPMDNDEYELVSTPNNASGIVKENITVTYTYRKKVPVPQTGTITVKYVDEEGNEVSSSEVTTKEVGTSYTSKPKEIEGYIIKEKPSTESYTYGSDAQTVTYVYERIRLKVSTKVRNNIGGNIEGDEEVLYGNNSTANKIHIKANVGYVINKVYINGSEIEVPKDSSELNISNFIKMNEDKLVEVEFKEVKKDLVVKVPPTSAQTIYTILGMLGLISVGVFGIYYNKKLN